MALAMMVNNFAFVLGYFFEFTYENENVVVEFCVELAELVELVEQQASEYD